MGGGACYSEFLFPGSPHGWRIWFYFAPPIQCLQIAWEGQGSPLSSKEPGQAAKELYIAPPWRCAYTGTRTDAHAGFGMKNRTARNGYTSHLLLSHFIFFRNFPSMVSDFPAILLLPATSNLIPVGIRTGPTPSSQIRSPREDALESILTQSFD